MFPSMYSHRCSVGTPGGFSTGWRRTWMATSSSTLFWNPNPGGYGHGFRTHYAIMARKEFIMWCFHTSKNQALCSESGCSHLSGFDWWKGIRFRRRHPAHAWVARSRTLGPSTDRSWKKQLAGYSVDLVEQIFLCQLGCHPIKSESKLRSPARLPVLSRTGLR